MTNFTIMDGLMLMIVAMAAVFAVLMGLWGLLVIVRKLTEEKENNQPLPTSKQAASPVSQEKNTEETSEQGSIPPEKVALIMSLLVDKHKRDKN